MLDPQTTALLASGCALLVGTVGPDGEPHSGRGWGLTLLATEPVIRMRLLLDGDDAVTIANVAAEGAVAVTAASVRTLFSTQLKGRSLGIEPLSAEDEARAQQYATELFTDIVETDHTDPALLESFLPSGFVACVLELHERFLQTPGPEAGARVDAP